MCYPMCVCVCLCVNYEAGREGRGKEKEGCGCPGDFAFFFSFFPDPSPICLLSVFCLDGDRIACAPVGLNENIKRAIRNPRAELLLPLCRSWSFLFAFVFLFSRKISS